ncbi:3543_t:CDS:2, partial [Dentiscutata heterogama]
KIKTLADRAFESVNELELAVGSEETNNKEMYTILYIVKFVHSYWSIQL